MTEKQLFEVDCSLNPPSCLPAGIDMSDLVDITCIGDSWRKYFNTRTGKTHDGAEYYKRATELLNDSVT